MPTFGEVKDAATDLAKVAGPDCVPSYLFWLADNAARRPEDWGFPRSYRTRPNWDAHSLRREISAVLWRIPTHPDRIAPAFRGLPFRTLSTIADGCIEYLWRDAPSSKVRTEWLTAVACARRHRATEWEGWLANPWTWFCRHVPIGDYLPRSRAIAEWLVAKKAWAGWRRPFPLGYGPDGEMVTVPVQSMLDEVEDRDLVGGAKSNPERVFRAVLERKSAAGLAAVAAQNAPFPAMPWTEIPGVTQIRSGAALVTEGQRMAHCVGGYAERCRQGDCFILRLPASTAEISPDGRVYQHRARSNAAPSPTDVALLDQWCAKRKRIP